jgi:hypothetical protein
MRREGVHRYLLLSDHTVKEERNQRSATLGTISPRLSRIGTRVPSQTSGSRCEYRSADAKEAGGIGQ